MLIIICLYYSAKKGGAGVTVSTRILVEIPRVLFTVAEL